MPKDLLVKKIFSRSPPKILNKKEMYHLYHKGFFGNKPKKTWESYDNLINSGYQGLVTIRSLKGIDRNNVEYEVPYEKREATINEFLSNEHELSDLLFNESMPDKNIIFQGEVMRNEYGLDLRYSTLKLPMNEALKKEDKYAKRLQAKMLLENAMDPSSYENMEEIFGVFPESVIEFSIWNKNVGMFPGRNTVFWEVRNF